jgi:hypothetical protein
VKPEVGHARRAVVRHRKQNANAEALDMNVVGYDADRIERPNSVPSAYKAYEFGAVGSQLQSGSMSSFVTYKVPPLANRTFGHCSDAGGLIRSSITMVRFAKNLRCVILGVLK